MLLTVVLNFLFLVKFLYHTLKGMSQSVHPTAPSNSETNNDTEEKCEEEVSTSTSQELSVLRVADVNGPVQTPYVTSGIFLDGFWKNINYETLPPDRLEAVQKIEKLYKFPRRNLLHTFIKTTNLGKHQRRRLCYNKIELPRNNICVNYDALNEANFEGNIRRLRSQLSKDRRVVYAFDISKLGRRIKWHPRGPSFKDILSCTFCQRLPSVETISFLQGGPFKTNVLLDRPSDIWDYKEEDSRFKDTPEKRNGAQDIADLFEKLDLNQRDGRNQGSSKSLDVEDADPSRDNASNWSRSDLSDPNSQFFDKPLDPQPKMDFSCGDDSRITEENLESVDQICESKVRSVQWNNEVDVIYYAGDADGGKIIRREREPLQEEADQQARNKFIQLVLNKNLISSMSGY